jgi:hypothetical protein
MPSDSATAWTAGPFAPSELVLLYGERFTTAQVLLGRTGDPQVALLHADITVSARQLGQAILAVAFLANDRAGAIRLDPRPATKLFGLSSSDSLFADPLEEEVNWPSSTLESHIRSIAGRLHDKQQNEISTIIAEIVPTSPEPWTAITGLVIQGLGERGLLDAVPVVDSEEPTIKQWVLSESTRKQAAEQDISPIEQLLAQAEQDRPEVWNRLVDQIKDSVQQRKE